MFDKLMKENGIPAQERSAFFEGLKENSLDKEAMHPAGAAIGALAGGAYSVHQAKKRHTPMGKGMESPYSNKIRHEMAHHLETRMNKENPTKMDKMRERLIAGKLRYARLSQKDPHKAMLLEGALGAGTGAVGGSQVGTAIAGSKALAIAKMSSALQVADVCGVSRGVLEKKAHHLGIPLNEAAELEVIAAALTKKAQAVGLDPDEAAFMQGMSATQNAVMGHTPPVIKKAARSKTVMNALRREKRASLGALLMKREMAGEVDRVAAGNLPEEAMPPSEPEDYRAPVREERRDALSDLFGGPAGQQ
jgi:hypothetical protein